VVPKVVQHPKGDGPRAASHGRRLVKLNPPVIFFTFTSLTATSAATGTIFPLFFILDDYYYG